MPFDSIDLGPLSQSNVVQFCIGPNSSRVRGMYQHCSNGALIIDVRVFQRHHNLYGVNIEYPPTWWDDVVQALTVNRGLKMSYIFNGVLAGSVTLPMKLLSISTDFSHGPHEPVYDVLRFIHEAKYA